ncbi:MAG: hypothetical protein QG652_1796 [Pseudomonadota bacterium]|nr:hypothetical protein [Pseudomonadota bacterium]
MQPVPALHHPATRQTGGMIPMRRPACTIDEMETLLGQLVEFESRIQKPGQLDSPAFRQEYRLFRQYLQWRLEDFNKAMRDEMNSHIKGLS